MLASVLAELLMGCAPEIPMPTALTENVIMATPTEIQVPTRGFDVIASGDWVASTDFGEMT